MAVDGLTEFDRESSVSAGENPGGWRGLHDEREDNAGWAALA
jgi:hypothetical protein